MNARLRALLRCLEESFYNDIETPGQRYRNASPDTAVDHSRMKTVGCYPGTLESAGELKGEDYICVLRHVVEIRRYRRRGIYVAEIQRRNSVQLRCYDDNATRC